MLPKQSFIILNSRYHPKLALTIIHIDIGKWALKLRKKNKRKHKESSLHSILPTDRKEEQDRSVLPVSEANNIKCYIKQNHLSITTKKKKGNQHTYHFIHRKDRLKTEEKSSVIREIGNRNFKKMQ